MVLKLTFQRKSFSFHIMIFVWTICADNFLFIFSMVRTHYHKNHAIHSSLWWMFANADYNTNHSLWMFRKRITTPSHTFHRLIFSHTPAQSGPEDIHHVDISIKVGLSSNLIITYAFTICPRYFHGYVQLHISTIITYWLSLEGTNRQTRNLKHNNLFFKKKGEGFIYKTHGRCKFHNYLRAKFISLAL
jgi:hypothetical protein